MPMYWLNECATLLHLQIQKFKAYKALILISFYVLYQESLLKKESVEYLYSFYCPKYSYFVLKQVIKLINSEMCSLLQ